MYEKPWAVWTKEAPTELVDVMKYIKPGKAIDLGCGEGLYSIYLDSLGFDVIGVDISEKAIQYAKENIKKVGANILVYQMDLLTELEDIEEKFDFVLEWAIMHSIPFEDRERYVKNIAKILNKNGKYLVVCFNIDSPEWGGAGKRIRQSPLNSTLYYSSQEELVKLFSPYLKIIKKEIIPMEGKTSEFSHIGNLFLLERLD